MEQLIAFAGQHALLSAAWFAIVVMIIVLSIKIKLSPIKQISTQELTLLVNRQDGVVVDIRADKDFKSHHIVDAVPYANDKLNNKDFSGLEKYKDRPIIVVCATGLTAVKAADLLFKSGFSQVSILKGGMNAWLSAGLPVVKK